ncbi:MULTISPECIES: CBS domain-containing protein [Methanobacterium]|uniref:Inosine-5-monophosphate dehydrogenase n=1 Tax=Methanobacterium bryantii TaxID=2161 RepID=A0A2A2H6U0_METBR|nr:MULTISPECIES: CBS domain-containing protein [Methanobacterium]OEC84978.1 inosine-5-monophosphate dehydrogenase [Methanobacterium sp. A39]PAV05129.1 inosine-5-monophosphate dehydrogenase [Methanobacterium bryantii]
MEMETKVTVNDAMTSNVVTVSSENSAADAAYLMSQNEVGCLIVKNNNEPEGIVTETDIINKVVAHDIKASEISIDAIMTKNLIKIDPGRELNEAARFMSKMNIRRLAVVKDGVLKGILTAKDIMAVSPELTEILVENARMENQKNQMDHENINPPVPGVCEACGNFMDDLDEIDGKFVCEDCKEDLEGDLI